MIYKKIEKIVLLNTSLFLFFFSVYYWWHVNRCGGGDATRNCGVNLMVKILTHWMVGPRWWCIRELWWGDKNQLSSGWTGIVIMMKVTVISKIDESWWFINKDISGINKYLWRLVGVEENSENSDGSRRWLDENSGNGYQWSMKVEEIGMNLTSQNIIYIVQIHCIFFYSSLYFTFFHFFCRTFF